MPRSTDVRFGPDRVHATYQEVKPINRARNVTTGLKSGNPPVAELKTEHK